MILVSGATGFLGAHLACYILQQGKTIRAIKRNSSSLDEFNYIFSLYFGELTDIEQQNYRQKIAWKDADILDIPALEIAFDGISEVYHAAATVSFLQKHKQMMHEINVTGTTNMVNIALEKKVQKFCYVSSIAALGREKNGIAISEDSKWVESSLNSNYAVSKHKAEMEVWRAMEEGLPAVIVNPGVILGAGNWNKGSCKLFELPWKSFPFYTNGINGYVDVRDVAKAMYLLMQRPETFSNRYVLVSKNMDMQEFMHTVAGHYQKAKAKFKVTRWMAEMAWILFAIKSIFTGKEAVITKENARASLKTYFYSHKKIENAIGFSFIPMEETLLYTSTIFKQNHLQ